MKKQIRDCKKQKWKRLTQEDLDKLFGKDNFKIIWMASENKKYVVINDRRGNKAILNKETNEPLFINTHLPIYIRGEIVLIGEDKFYRASDMKFLIQGQYIENSKYYFVKQMNNVWMLNKETGNKKLCEY